MNTPFLDFPFHLDGRGRTGTTDDDDHLRDLIMQVLFTNPGERVNRPHFGCGVKALIFMPNSDVLATATQALVKASLQRWLDTLIDLEEVAVRTEDERLVVTVAYRKRLSPERLVDTFAMPSAGSGA